MSRGSKSVLIERVRCMDFWRAYRSCRAVGEWPWCSLRLAILSRFQ
jgi:hypothetical protein